MANECNCLSQNDTKHLGSILKHESKHLPEVRCDTCRNQKLFHSFLDSFSCYSILLYIESVCFSGISTCSPWICLLEIQDKQSQLLFQIIGLNYVSTSTMFLIQNVLNLILKAKQLSLNLYISHDFLIRRRNNNSNNSTLWGDTNWWQYY